MRAALAAASILALAQAQQPPNFRGGVSLVTVDVSVVDQDGQPVTDLAAADFEIKLNNRAQPIRGFGYLQTAPTAMAGAVGPSFDTAPVAAAAKGATTVPRVFIVLVDDLSFSPLAGKDLLSAARRFVSSLPATDVVGLTTTTGTLTVNPTTDRAPILAAIPKISGAFQDPRFESSGPLDGRFTSPDQQVGLAQALAIDRGEQGVLRDVIVTECFFGDASRMPYPTIEDVLAHDSCARTVQLSATRTGAQLKAQVRRQAHAYEAVIRAMGAASGIRHLVILTDGVALAQDLAEMQPVASAAAAAGVQLSIMMDTPESVSLTEGGRRQPPPAQRQQADTGAPQRRREDNALLLNGARTTAEMTGAEFFQITGEPDRFFDRVALLASGIYRIAVEAPADTAPGKDFALSVRVPARPGVVVRANRHAVAAPTTSLTTTTAATTAAPAATPKAFVPPEEQMKRAIASGRALNGLDVSIERAVRRDDDATKVAINVTLKVAGTPTAPIAMMFGLVDASGGIRTSSKTLNEKDGDDFRFAFAVPVAPGAYRLRFAAADASGAVGSIEVPVDASLTRMGPLQASGLTVEPLPGEGRTVLASLELYPDASVPSPDVIVKMALMSGGSEPVVERVVVPELVDGVLRAEAEFARDRLPPGAYTVRATVLSGQTVLGTLTEPVK